MTQLEGVRPKAFKSRSNMDHPNEDAQRMQLRPKNDQMTVLRNVLYMME